MSCELDRIWCLVLKIKSCSLPSLLYSFLIDCDHIRKKLDFANRLEQTTTFEVGWNMFLPRNVLMTMFSRPPVFFLIKTEQLNRFLLLWNVTKLKKFLNCPTFVRFPNTIFFFRLSSIQPILTSRKKQRYCPPLPPLWTLFYDADCWKYSAIYKCYLWNYKLWKYYPHI